MSDSDKKIVGKSLARVDAVEKVTGEARYIADINHSDCLNVKFVRSPHGHAKIKKIVFVEALKSPGVRKIITGKDIRNKTGTIIKDINLMAYGKVRFAGEVVAAVIADTEINATRAAALVKVNYEELPAVTDPKEATAPEAPLVHEDKKSNIYYHYKLRKGDVNDGFKKAYLVEENEFAIPHMSHTALENHGCIAHWMKEGRLEITTSSQAPFVLKEFLAELMGVSQSRIRVKIPYVGGGFGGKSDMTIEPLASMIARQVPGTPVRIILSREEAFCGSLLGRGMRGKIKTGVTSDGKITAEEITMYFNAGAYGDYCLPVVAGGGQNSSGPYLNDNIKVDAYGVYTNTPYVGAFRGYGHPEGNWMKERQLNIIAKKLGVDPVEIRLKNCWKHGSMNHIGQEIEGSAGKISDCIKKASEIIGYQGQRKTITKDKIISKGLAAFMKSPVMATNGFSTALLRINPDGSVNLSVGTIDIGQGSITALTQICAEALGIDIEKIHMARDTDTQFSAYEWQTVASRGTWSVGNAIVKASADAVKQLKNNAAIFFKCPASEIEYNRGYLYRKKAPSKRHPLEKFSLGYTHPDGHTEGSPVVGHGAFVPSIQYPDPVTGQGRVVAEWTGGCQAAEIEIDRGTGAISVRRFVTVIDAGTVVNPQMARGQILGAVVQGLGQALSEGVVYSKGGDQRTHNFTDYKIPTPEDLWKTKMEVVFLDTYEDETPFGARCLGEHAIVSVPSVLGNALAEATGYEPKRIPITADIVLASLKGEA